ncbi:rho-related gtp-binding protein rhoq [Anaeramoeba ignava]|uniref:Rho-related gtp-binding protein rhoq n=1 Tax=Anaeramoeba ignava TaxID=1746090 RepID=A0A9Q0LV55_ANAIG|nr:rho-related gtp-binding protein rhoq [Anaeramoeba ignava]
MFSQTQKGIKTIFDDQAVRVDFKIKCVVVGDDNSQRTEMLYNFKVDEFSDQEIPEICENFVVEIESQEKEYMF